MFLHVQAQDMKNLDSDFIELKKNTGTSTKQEPKQINQFHLIEKMCLLLKILLNILKVCNQNDRPCRACPIKF